MASSNRSGAKILYWVIGIIIFLILASTLLHWIVKWNWLEGVGYPRIFWKIKGTQLLLFFGALVVSLFYVILNMYFLSKNIPYIYLNFEQSPFEEVGIKYINIK